MRFQTIKYKYTTWYKHLIWLIIFTLILIQSYVELWQAWLIMVWDRAGAYCRIKGEIVIRVHQADCLGIGSSQPQHCHQTVLVLIQGWRITSQGSQMNDAVESHIRYVIAQLDLSSTGLVYLKLQSPMVLWFGHTLYFALWTDPKPPVQSYFHLRTV